MRVGDITELFLMGVFDRGKPNQERIVLFVNELVNMGQFGLMLGVRQQDGFAFPIRDNFYWFGDGYVSPGDWIFLYTDPGEPRNSVIPNSSNNTYSLHWGRDEVILGNPEIVPILFRVDAVNILTETPALPNSSG